MIFLSCSYAVMRSCWEEDPENRPTFAELVLDLDLVNNQQRLLAKYPASHHRGHHKLYVPNIIWVT